MPFAVFNDLRFIILAAAARTQEVQHEDDVDMDEIVNELNGEVSDFSIPGVCRDETQKVTDSKSRT